MFKVEQHKGTPITPPFLCWTKAGWIVCIFLAFCRGKWQGLWRDHKHCLLAAQLLQVRGHRSTPRSTRHCDSPPQGGEGRTQAAAMPLCIPAAGANRSGMGQGSRSWHHAPRNARCILSRASTAGGLREPTSTVPAGFAGELEESSPATGSTPGSQPATAAKHLDSWH